MEPALDEEIHQTYLKTFQDANSESGNRLSCESYPLSSEPTTDTDSILVYQIENNKCGSIMQAFAKCDVLPKVWYVISRNV